MNKFAVLGVVVAGLGCVQNARATLYTWSYNFNAAPPPGFVAGSTSYTEPSYGYTLTAASGSNLNWGVFSGPIGLNINSNLTITRADHHLFSIDSLTIYYAGTTTSGLLDFDVIPFDAAGVEGTPITLGIYGPGINPLGSVASGLSQVSFQFQGGSYKIMSIALTSDVPPTPAPGALSLLGLAGGMAVRRRRTARSPH